MREAKTTFLNRNMCLPEDLSKLVLEVTAGCVEVVQVGQDTTLGRGTVCRVHT